MLKGTKYTKATIRNLLYITFTFTIRSKSLVRLFLECCLIRCGRSIKSTFTLLVHRAQLWTTLRCTQRNVFLTFYSSAFHAQIFLCAPLSSLFHWPDKVALILTNSYLISICNGIWTFFCPWVRLFFVGRFLCSNFCKCIKPQNEKSTLSLWAVYKHYINHLKVNFRLWNIYATLEGL